ncbi:hypothetical protein PFISCL1PPCAC_27184 [Pristionchus fissidentatus]|uniref:ABC transmembrane type-1 domain-containing protein n=1 Tax=Pristionchus fissidentatus TaxID=1538716 RepID=A0AAV5WV11_9BILA|nr:hypothetical protein PFISCL1PPCAC_27184 [Pristionchus fissidentatus]
MGIDSFGLSVNTLEQVFLRVGELTGAKNRSEIVQEKLTALLEENENRLVGLAGYGKQFLYLQYKRICYELIHYKSFLLIFLPLIGLIYLAAKLPEMMDGMRRRGYERESNDVLSFPQCARIGIEKSSGLVDKFRSALPPNSDCIVLEEIDNVKKWFEDTELLYRPPILAAVSRDIELGELVLHQAPSRHLSFPALAATFIRALSSEPFKLSIHHVNARMTSENESSQSADSDDSQNTHDMNLDSMVIAVFLLTLPILIHRFIGFYVVERSIKFGHQVMLRKECFSYQKARKNMKKHKYFFLIYKINEIYYLISNFLMVSPKSGSGLLLSFPTI